ncbi:hypothetical protein JOM56_002830 [Amanita muscaria]
MTVNEASGSDAHAASRCKDSEQTSTKCTVSTVHRHFGYGYGTAVYGPTRLRKTCVQRMIVRVHALMCHPSQRDNDDDNDEGDDHIAAVDDSESKSEAITLLVDNIQSISITKVVQQQLKKCYCLFRIS